MKINYNTCCQLWCDCF